MTLSISLILGGAVAGRYKLASHALAGGATAIVALALAGIVHPDPRNGQAAIDLASALYLALIWLEFFWHW